MARIFRVGLIMIDEARQALITGDTHVQVDAKPLAIILFVASNASRLVSNQEIATAVWQGSVRDETYRVTLSAANTAFKEALRKAHPDHEPVSFYKRPKTGYLQWALTPLEDLSAELPGLTPPAALDRITPDAPAKPQAAVVKPIKTGAQAKPYTLAFPRWMPWLAAAVLMLALGWAFWERWPAVRQVSRIRIQADTLFALDQQGRALWSHTFPEGLGLYDQRESELQEHFLAADLDLDGKNELLFIEKPPKNKQSMGPRLVYFTSDGTLLRSLEPGALVLGPNPVRDRYSRPYVFQKLLLIPHQPFPRVAVVSIHHTDAPSQVLILDCPTFTVLGQYWHPGHLNVMELVKLENDGKERVILGGVNNQHHSATAVVLDSEHVSGTTRPIIDLRVPNQRDFALLSSGEDDNSLSPLALGSERAVILFPRSDIMFRGTFSIEPFNRVYWLLPELSGFSAIVAESITATAPETITYHFDRFLNIVEVSPSVEYQNKHQELFERGLLNHRFSQDDIQRLKGNVVIVKYPAPR